MANSQITTGGPVAVTGAGAVSGSLDTSGMTGDYTLFLEVSQLDSGDIAIIAIEDTANASAFSEAVQVWVPKHFKGPLVSTDPIKQSTRLYEIPGTRFGVTNSKLRANVLSLSGSSPHCTVNAWLAQ